MEPKHSTPSGSVAEQLGEIADWLHGNLATMPLRGATPEQIEQAIAATGRPWPDELIEFFTRLNGFPIEQWVQLLPGDELFDLDRVVHERQLELDVWGPMSQDMGLEVDPTARAGDPAGTFLPEFIPFAGQDGYLLFVDTRPGELHGCVTRSVSTQGTEGGQQRQKIAECVAPQGIRWVVHFAGGAPGSSWVPV